MTKAELLKALESVPDDVEIVGFNEEFGMETEVVKAVLIEFIHIGGGRKRYSPAVVLLPRNEPGPDGQVLFQEESER